MLGNLKMIFPNTQQSQDVGCTPSALSGAVQLATCREGRMATEAMQIPGCPSSLLQEPGPARLNYPKRPSGIWPKA